MPCLRRWYKTPDGKPLNGFGFDEALIPADHVMEVIDETHHHWKNLRSGKQACIPMATA